MIVRNLFVNDVEIYIDALLRELIKQGISYVRVENEIHFENYIIRLYDKDEIKSLIQIHVEEECEKRYSNLEFMPSGYLDLFDSSKKYDGKYLRNSSFQKNNKQLIKQQNRLTNKLIRTKKIK